ncbi:50S ribosomal protein L17 [Haploplasma modicum]|jgi:large subunit ribosomal protein L17|uniref:50S ribosomal protein L17 n=1 Tax=Haploplasma modicum TaxID=2150 RepID=UPI00214C7E77|nr:50S ribosomal protein L17 [Haploplasma modicum]MCR1808630.1 50S ribosomal protein L17 [Haploplasma modicum]
MSYSKLGRNSSQRKALLRDLVTDLIIHERITTTEAKAFELKKLADKMITLAKKEDLAARRKAAETVRFEPTLEENQNAIQKLFTVLGPRYKDRNGGYTRIIKTVPRRGDAAAMAIIEFV